MNWRFPSVIAIALALAASPALAQGGHQENRGEYRRNAQHTAPSRTERHSAPSFRQANPSAFGEGARMRSGHRGMVNTASPAAALHYEPRGERFRSRSNYYENHAVNRAYSVNGHADRGAHRAYPVNGRAYQHNYSHERRGADAWSNWHRQHPEFRLHSAYASRRYHYRGSYWHWPDGYRYHRWSFDMFLPSIFWAQEYWIGDYYYYGLPPPPPGCVWVRYGPDAILIDRFTGEILEVIYGEFY